MEKVIIHIDESCDMAFVEVPCDDTLNYEGNFGDFYPGCYGEDKRIGDFDGFSEYAEKVVKHLKTIGVNAKIEFDRNWVYED